MQMTFTVLQSIVKLVDLPSGGGGGMSHWGLYIILINHFLKSTLNEDEAPIPTAL